MKGMLWNRRAISPVVSTLLLTAITVALMSITVTATYFITNNLRETMSERFIIEDVWFNETSLEMKDRISIHIRNIGKTTIEIAGVYVNYTQASIVSAITSFDMEQSDWLVVSYTWTANQIYHINVVTTRGTQYADYYRSPT